MIPDVLRELLIYIQIGRNWTYSIHYRAKHVSRRHVLRDARMGIKKLDQKTLQYFD